jgi:hypothetical protein
MCRTKLLTVDARPAVGDNVICASDRGSYHRVLRIRKNSTASPTILTEILRDDMGFARFYRRFVFALTAIGLMAGSAVAQLDLPAPPKASLLDLTLTPGGSNDPPGDRLVAPS